MIITDSCSSSSDPKQRRRRFQIRKLEMLSLYRDALERRLAAANASIAALETQINRDENTTAA